MRISAGYWVLGRFRGRSVRLHWTLLLGALIFSGFQPSLAFLVAFPALISVHELGHAFVASHFGHTVTAVEATGAGGQCQWSGNASLFEQAVIAWGGVLAQLLLLCTVELWSWRVGAPGSAFGWQVTRVLTRTNLYLMAVNLMPIAPFDGVRAWNIFSAWHARGQKSVPYATWRGAPTQPSEEGALEPQNQRAIDELVRRTTGKVRRADKRDP